MSFSPSESRRVVESIVYTIAKDIRTCDPKEMVALVQSIKRKLEMVDLVFESTVIVKKKKASKKKLSVESSSDSASVSDAKKRKHV